MFPYSRRVMIRLRRPLRCCFIRSCFGAFRSIAASSFASISPGSKHFVGSGFWPNCLSQKCCVRRVSLRVPKHLDSCSTFHKAVVTSRAFPSHFFLGSKGWILPRPLHPMWNRVQSEKAAVRWRCFPGRSALFPMRRALSPRKS